MIHHKAAEPKMPRALQRLKEAVTSRRAVINELNFIYTRLLRLLPGIIKRVHTDPVKEVLSGQHHMDQVIAERLGEVAKAQGEPPEPCACEEADALVEDIYNAERAAPTKAARASATVRALRSLRTYLIRAWGRLIATLSPSERPWFRKEITALQRSEADLHRELVSLGKQIEVSTGRADAKDSTEESRQVPHRGS